jgi:hypothetical protein
MELRKNESFVHAGEPLVIPFFQSVIINCQIISPLKISSVTCKVYEAPIGKFGVFIPTSPFQMFSAGI